MRSYRLRTCASVLLICVAQLGWSQVADDMYLPPVGDWPQHGRTPDNQRFSPLVAIDRSNVHSLRLVWSRNLGRNGPSQGGATAWNGYLYVSTETGVVALDATDGRTAWVYEEALSEDRYVSSRAPRGSPLVYEGKVYATLAAGSVVALDAMTGELSWRRTFRDQQFAEGFSSNPMFADGLILVSPTGASQGPVPGRLIALDALDGSTVWITNLVPVDPADPAFSTWQPTAPLWSNGIGGGAVWNVGAYDAGTGTAIFGTGHPVPADRLDWRRKNEGPASPDLYTSGFVGVDVRTGVIRWFHQVVPGDEWEYGQDTIPIVADVEIEGSQRRVAILATTTGYVVLLDPGSGEFLRAHQMSPEVTVHLGYSSNGTALVDDAMRFVDGTEPRRLCPGAQWAGVAPGAYSPETGLMYRPNETACMRRVAEAKSSDYDHDFAPTWLHAEPRLEGDHYERWGALSAIDPIDGTVVWEFALGYPHDAGALATAGGLVFAAFADRTFRAFDAETGEVLWEQLLTAHSEGSPISYEVDGVQYVAVIVGHSTGTSGMPQLDLPRTVTGDTAIFVFSLR